MRSLLLHYVPCILLVNQVHLDTWLAAAERIKPDAFKPCPVSCSEARNMTSGAGWFLYPDSSKLAECNETMLLNMSVQPLNEDNTPAKGPIRACSADYDTNQRPVFVANELKASLCTTANRILEEDFIQIHRSVEHSTGSFSQADLLKNVLEFAYSQTAAIGLYVGIELHQHGITADVLESFIEYVGENAISETTIVQLCGADNRGADYNIGLVATSADNLSFIRESVRIWATGGCVSKTGAGQDWKKVTLRIPGVRIANSANGTNATTSPQPSQPSSIHVSAKSRLSIRAECKTTTIQSGDGCKELAKRCGIDQSKFEEYNGADICSTLTLYDSVCCSVGTLPVTLPPGNADGTCKLRTVEYRDDCTTLPGKCGISANDFMKANPKANLCSTLLPGQQVCCTAGKRPDLTPKPEANGNCATHTVLADETCSSIAIARDLDPKDLEDFNKNAWGWNGCDPKKFFRDFVMCVSSGTPPMPAAVANAVCGPTMPGTVKPPSGTNLSSLNPCPLNVCCNIWGQCGMTDDYCTVEKSATDIIKGAAPPSRIKVAYYESWNFNRECLHMSVDAIPSNYTHIHFAFANVTADFKPEITDERVQEQFEIFKEMPDVKKIISFGGWDFSTMPGTYSIMREAAKPANRETFKNNIVAFVNEHNLDGVDLDWEYPGAPDIPGIPSDDPQNGLNYYRLLSSIKSALGSSKSVSFAAPASFWYLKSYPIKNMAKDLDYIIYMTYDLHGQWDYGNKWTSPGCEKGNCLRSHVNETETNDALAMITKAGAPSNKVVVGVASYGRSFKMEQAGCDEEMCTFTGSPRVSNAHKGRCTDTAGYISNAEIQEILDRGNVNRQWTSEGSNILVYNDTEWVAYMSDDMKTKRSAFYDSYNFAGTTDWAVDLQQWWDCASSYISFEQLEEDADWTRPHCMEEYILQVELVVYKNALEKYKELIDDGYDGKFKTYERYVKEQIPLQVNNFMVSDKVDKYFTCKNYKCMACCDGCKYGCGVPGKDCFRGSDCVAGYQSLDMDACPRYEFRPPVISGDYIPNATFTLKDKDGFFKDLADTWGIAQEWIDFGNRLIRVNPNVCIGAGSDVQDCMLKNNNYLWNYPIPDDNIEIYNPKDVLGASYSNATDMRDRIDVMYQMGNYDGQMDLRDLVDASSLPSFSLEEAIESMAKIVEQANEIEKKERDMIRLIGGVGDAALTVYDIVQSPENAFMAVFMYLAGAGVGRSGFRNAANSRRSISKEDLDSLGNVKVRLDKIESLRVRSCPA
ncbi:glycoside hydrolase [Bimuria novae-zelandiae CBS 107.79]|uniref:chitinase n=1 Tax=Bimuria novae-zelandiae CBS 107.79 TaxID=1447943 RepID=A0A6A5VAK3_9PLEO|nr:glycoside hydrolase [Bimuria novae-zelandiae CBS 107.79]